MKTPADPEEPSLPQKSSTSAWDKRKEKENLEHIMIMLSSWRRPDHDADPLYVRQLQAILREYPPSVVSAVMSPTTGIQRRSQFTPTIVEMVKALDAEMNAFRNRNVEARNSRLMLEKRFERSEHVSMDELRAKYPDFLGKKTERRAGEMRSLGDIARECGVTQEQIDALPSAKPRKD